MNRRLNPTDRREQILAAAVELADCSGLTALTFDAVAQAARCSKALVVRYFYTTAEMRQHVMTRAVTEERLRVIADGLVARDAVALSAHGWLKARALAAVARG